MTDQPPQLSPAVDPDLLVIAQARMVAYRTRAAAIDVTRQEITHHERLGNPARRLERLREIVTIIESLPEPTPIRKI